ncbi:magnesium/cobalt transporter CorA [Tautonia sociabilis]|uniref:Magnesium transport protein CorA n=1 Tax=Tautonia sociabilis TaxID=2080755 RepID=A0A432MG38_9BACT|nr:magnesium/cobalt transporter CorA [Tautonia sociabilis]RUL85290.1 magnesium/cobalt transporter CorA [Tautonia sociabilis]
MAEAVEVERADAEAAGMPRLRAVYRESGGGIHADWPVDRIGEALADERGTLWLDVENPGGRPSAEVETLLRDVFNFHPLAVEDALGEANAPKVDDWGRYLTIVFHAIDFDPDRDEVRLHELDLFLGANFLVTYHIEPLSSLDRLRRLVDRDASDRLAHGADHLAYLLLDAAVDEHMAAIEHLDDAIDDLQDRVFHRVHPRMLHEIFRVKRSVLRVHRILTPQREVANRLARDPYPMIDDRDRVYFRDVYDHLVRLHDITDGIRDLVTSTLETYLSVSANRTNEVMKALTLITYLFLPLNFLVGFFGMNFFGDNIQLAGLRLPHVTIFVSALVVMVTSPLMLYLWARRKRWF